MEKAGAVLGLERKTGVLVTGGTPEPSLAFELAKTSTDHWLTSGWSLDAITTPWRGGLGIARDVYRGRTFEVDVGGYFTQDYADLFQGRIEPALGMGLSIRF